MKMTPASKLFLGWQNPKSAIAIKGQDIVVLIDEHDKSCVLQGDEALEFKTKLAQINNHLEGFQSYHWVHQEILKQPQGRHHLPLYNSLFERYFQ